MSIGAVSITPGSGAPIAVDAVGGASYQIIKRTFGAAGYADELQTAQINAAANGDNIIVAAAATKIVRCYGFWFSSAAAVNVKFKDGAGTDLHPAISLLGAGAFFMLPRDGAPWFITSAGNALILNLSAAVQCSGIMYHANT